MKKNLIIIISIFIIVCNAYSQIELKSANLFGDYSIFLENKSAVTKATGPGFGAAAQFKINDNFSFTIHGSYNFMTVEQDSALEQWNWRFWNERYKGIVKDNLKSDTAITASLVAEQNIDIYSLFVTLDADLDLKFIENLGIKPYFGLGMIFYTRQLYLNETWKKYFSTVDYQFEYNYRNFAPNKNNNTFMSVVGLDLTYKFAENFMLNAGSRIEFILNHKAKNDPDDLPVEKLINFKLGIIFLY